MSVKINRDDNMKEVKYRCSNSKCGATDMGRFFPNEAPFPVINCYKCHAGQGLDIGTMIAQGKGMFPIQQAA